MKVVALACLLAVQPVAAQVGFGGKIGTLGAGAELSLGLGSHIGLRGGVTFMPVQPSGTFSDIKYEVDLPTPMFTVGADIYIASGLRLIGGVLLGANETDLTRSYTNTADVGNGDYAAAQLGTLSGVIGTSSTAPFAGLGFGKTFARGFGITLDLGGAFLGSPTVHLSADGACTRDPQCNAKLQQDLRIEEQQLESDLEKYAKIYPIVNLGFRIGVGRKPNG